MCISYFVNIIGEWKKKKKKDFQVTHEGSKIKQ